MAAPVTLPCCAFCCAVLSAFAIMILLVVGGLLIQNSESIEIEKKKMEKGSYASFIVAGIYAGFLVLCSAYLFYRSKTKAYVKKSPSFQMQAMPVSPNDSKVINGASIFSQQLGVSEALVADSYKEKTSVLNPSTLKEGFQEHGKPLDISNTSSRKLGRTNSQVATQSLANLPKQGSTNTATPSVASIYPKSTTKAQAGRTSKGEAYAANNEREESVELATRQ